MIWDCSPGHLLHQYPPPSHTHTHSYTLIQLWKRGWELRNSFSLNFEDSEEIQVHFQSLSLAVMRPYPTSVPLLTHRWCGQASNELSQTVQENRFYPSTSPYEKQMTPFSEMASASRNPSLSLLCSKANTCLGFCPHAQTCSTGVERLSQGPGTWSQQTYTWAVTTECWDCFHNQGSGLMHPNTLCPLQNSHLGRL